MKIFKDTFFLLLLLGIASFVIYLIEDKKITSDTLFYTPVPTSTKKVNDKTDSVLLLVDKKIIEVSSLKKDNEMTIDYLKNKIKSGGYKSKNDLDNLKKQISDIERSRDSASQSAVLVRKAFSFRRPDTVYVVRHILDTVYLTKVVFLHDTLQSERFPKLKRLKVKIN